MAETRHLNPRHDLQISRVPAPIRGVFHRILAAAAPGPEPAAAGVQPGSARRRWLLVSAITERSILGFCKYFNIFVDSAEQALAKLGMEFPHWRLHIVLPVCISSTASKP